MQSDYENILQVDGLSKYFGGLAAVSNCSIKIKKGSITGVIGPNGSGKTTLFNLIAGNLKPNEGKVHLYGEDITGVASHELFSKGLLRTFQIAHEFTNLTVLENLMMVPGNQSGEDLINAWFKTKIVKEEEENQMDIDDEVKEDLKEEEEDDDDEIEYKRIKYKGERYYIVVGEEPQIVYEILEDEDVGLRVGIRKKKTKGTGYNIDFD